MGKNQLVKEDGCNVLAFLQKGKRYKITIIILLLAAVLRFALIGNETMEPDEEVYIAAGIKLVGEGNPKSWLFNYEHPPLAKYFIGIPSLFVGADYTAIYEYRLSHTWCMQSPRHNQYWNEVWSTAIYLLPSILFALFHYHPDDLKV